MKDIQPKNERLTEQDKRTPKCSASHSSDPPIAASPILSAMPTFDAHTHLPTSGWAGDSNSTMVTHVGCTAASLAFHSATMQAPPSSPPLSMELSVESTMAPQGCLNRSIACSCSAIPGLLQISRWTPHLWTS